MPELPEVETVKRGLRKLIIGLKIKSVKSDNPKSFPNNPSDVNMFMLGSQIMGIRRRAKVLMVDLDTNYTLVIHLKMTGQLVYVGKPVVRKLDLHGIPSSSKKPEPSKSRFGGGHPTDSLVDRLPDRSTRVTVEFSDLTNLYFNDQRKFGWMRLLPTAEVPDMDFMKRVGPEPLHPEFTWQILAERLHRRKNSTIKAVLLDQSVIAGIGNIYADESLWGAFIHPETRVVNLKSHKIKNLHSEILHVLNLSIEKGGSTDKNYVNAEGKRGSYIDFARVFRREGLPCSRCGAEIIKIRVASRGTHLCPVCQIK